MFLRSTTALRAGAAVLALLASAVLPAVAATDDADPGAFVRSVSSKGLDLTTTAGQAMLRHRVDVAAHKVCEAAIAADGLGSAGFTDCFLAAAANGRRQAETRIAVARSRAMLALTASK